jgi:flagellar hook-associated protein 3 FlgL
MKTTFISTKSISEATRVSVIKMQSKLLEAQKEISTGRLADIGKSLGYKTGETISLRQEHTRLTSMIDTNAGVTTRLDMTQAALKNIVDGAQDLLSQLIGARSSETGPGIAEGQAKGALAALTGALNSSISGVYLFSGINSDVKPVADYQQTPPGAAKLAVDNAFTTAFGFPQGDPAANSITPADMQTFLDGAFAGLFDPAQWTATWSSASDQNVRSRISTSELIETGTNANEEAFRKLASAYTMVADLGVEELSKETFQTVVDTAIKAIGEAIHGVSKLQANLGTVQERVAKANEKMSIQIDLISIRIGSLEGVDPYEASTRISALMTQIETAYALTARIQNLSLLNYMK